MRRLVIGIDLTLVMCLILAGLVTSSLPVAVPIAVGLSLAPAANAALFARLGATTPAHLQGRVLSVVFLFATGAAALAPVVTGVLVQQVNGLAAMVLCAVAVALSTVAAAFSRGFRG